MKNNDKKYILGIDTTSKIAGVALSNGKDIISESNLNTGLTHSVTLFKNIDKILKKNKITVKNIKKICVANGPGSFTGIRIGIAAALGLSVPYNTKISYVSSLKALAYNYIKECDYIISIIDAKVNRVYIAIFDYKTKKQILNDSIIDIDTLIKYMNKYFSNKNISFTFVGDGAVAYKEIFTKNLKVNYMYADKKNIFQKASSVIFASKDISKEPKINYMLASKAERERYAKS